MLGRLCAFVTWLRQHQCMIRDVNSRIIPLLPNAAQNVLLAAMMLQAAREVPIRIVILKARKLGASTLIQALLYFLCRHYRDQRALTLAHESGATHEIFGITRRAGRKDPQGQPTVNRTALTFPSDSEYSCFTAGGESQGAGGTPNCLHLSEVALWRRNKEETHTSVRDAVPFVPTTVIIEESTARGREAFYELFEAAHDTGHPYDPVFLPWFLDEELTAACGPDFQPDEDERQIAGLARCHGVSVTNEQFAWRRAKIAELGSLHLFRQEYPSTPEEAIEAASGLVVPGLRECLVSELPFDPRGLNPAERIGGIDWGYTDPTAIVDGCVWDGGLWITGVYRMTQTLAKDHAREIDFDRTYYCDPSDRQVREELGDAFRGLHANQFTADLLPAPAEEEEAGWSRLRQLMAAGKLHIWDEVADQILYEADALVYNERTGKPHKTRSEATGHFDVLDALRYCAAGMERAGALMLPRVERRTGRREALRR